MDRLQIGISFEDGPGIGWNLKKSIIWQDKEKRQEEVIYSLDQNTTQIEPSKIPLIHMIRVFSKRTWRISFVSTLNSDLNHP